MAEKFSSICYSFAAPSERAVFWARYSRGEMKAAWLNALEREFATVGLPVVTPPILTDSSVCEANNRSVELFLQTPCGWYLHVDDDQVMPDGALAAMLDATEHADVVTLHACNRNPLALRRYAGPFSEFDNHRKNADGEIIYFGQAVMLCRRRVFELLESPWWRPGHRVAPFGRDETGESWFCTSVLNHPELVHIALPLVSPHLETVVYAGAAIDFRAIPHDIGSGSMTHRMRVYGLES